MQLRECILFAMVRCVSNCLMMIALTCPARTLAWYSQPKNLCLNPQYGQCGGTDHHQPPRPWTPANHHQTCCPKSFFCNFQTKYYSQCIFNTTANTTCASSYAQCGGKGWTGKTCCIPGYKCTKQNEYFSACDPLPICTNARFGQCGGIDADGNPWDKAHHHSSCCPADFMCSYKNQYYSQCIKNGTSTSSSSDLLEEGDSLLVDPGE